MSTFHGHCWRIHIKIFSALCGWCTIFFFNILHLLHLVWPGGRSKTCSLISQISHFCQKIKNRSFFPFFLKAFGFQHSEIYTSKEISSNHNISFGCFSSAGFLKILQIVYCKYFDSCDLVKVSLNDPEKPFDHPGYSYQLKDGDSMDLKWCQRTDDCYKSCGNFPPCLQARGACCKL